MELNVVCFEKTKQCCCFLFPSSFCSTREMLLHAGEAGNWPSFPDHCCPAAGRCLAATTPSPTLLRMCLFSSFFSSPFFFKRFHGHKRKRKELLYRRLILCVTWAQAQLVNVKRKRKWITLTKISISFRAINAFADSESHLASAWLTQRIAGEEGWWVRGLFKC